MPFDLVPKTVISNVYTNAHFGGNFLATNDRLGEEGTLDEAVTALGFEALRYPGGALTEQFFGFIDPEADQVFDRDTGEAINISPVSEFNTFAAEQELSVAYVLPTRDFLGSETDRNGDRYADIDEEALRFFISTVAGGNFGGSPEVQAFEIGNEYWGASMSAVEYGRVASEMTLTIEDELTKLSNPERFNDTDIIVQMGMNYGSSNLSDKFDGTGKEQLAAINANYGLQLSESRYIYNSGEVAWTKVNNAIVLNEFDNTELDAVDGVVGHIYSRSSAIPESRYFELRQIKDTWLEESPSLDIYATEWNLKRTIDDTREEEYGLKQAHEMLNLMEAFSWGGVDAAHVWPVQMSSRTALTGLDGDETVSVAGEMFRLMKDSLPGSKSLDLLGSKGRETEISGQNADVHTFYAHDALVTYLASTSNEETEQIIDFNNLVTDPGALMITRLGVEEGSNPTASSAVPKLTDENPEELIEDGILIADLAPHEILVIEMNNPIYTEGLKRVVADVDEDIDLETIIDLFDLSVDEGLGEDVEEAIDVEIPSDAMVDEDVAQQQDEESQDGGPDALLTTDESGLSDMGLLLAVALIPLFLIAV